MYTFCIHEIFCHSLKRKYFCLRKFFTKSKIMRIKLIYGIMGLILGGLLTFFVFTPETTDLQNAEGSMGVKVDCPGIKYSIGQIINSECAIRPRSSCTYEDRGGCEYIMRNVGKGSINHGDHIQVMNVIVTRGGTTVLDVELPTG